MIAMEMLTFTDINLTEPEDPIINDESITFINESIMNHDDNNDPYVTTLQAVVLLCNDETERIFLVGHIYLPVAMYYNGEDAPLLYHWVDDDDPNIGECLAIYIMINPENNKYYRFIIKDKRNNEDNIIDISNFRREEGSERDGI